MNEHQAMAVLHRVRDDILVGPPPIEQVAAAATSRRRRRVVMLSAAAALMVGVTGAMLLAPSTPEGRPDPDPAIHPAENPVNLAWWADGRLHVAHAEVDMERPEFLVPVGDGVVVWTQAIPGGTESPLVHVADDGTRTPIGTRSGGYELASDPATGWVAWVDNPSSRGRPPVLVVYDTRAEQEVARRELENRGPRWQVLDEGPNPIAIEKGVVYYSAQDGDYRWDVANGDVDPELVTDVSTYLIDRRSDVEMLVSYDRNQGYHGWLIRRDGEPGVDLGGEGFRVVLSPDGRYLVGWSESGRHARIYEWEQDRPLPTGLPDDSLVADAAFGYDGTITYVLGTKQEPPENEGGIGPAFLPMPGEPFDLVTCTIATARCEAVVSGIVGDPVVLPTD